MGGGLIIICKAIFKDYDSFSSRISLYISGMDLRYCVLICGKDCG